MHAARLLDRLVRRQLTAEVHALGDLQPRCEPFQRDPLGPVADDHVAQRGMALGEHRQRAQHVGVALARHQMAHRHERRRALLAPAARAAWLGQVGSEVHHARVAGAVLVRQLGDAAAVRKHHGGGAEVALDRFAPGLGARRRVEHVAAVHRHHQRHARGGRGAPRRRRAPRCGRG